jgi:hypothetical protein
MKPLGGQKELFSFVGGLIFSAAVVAVLLSNDKGLRTELKHQAHDLLGISKDVLRQTQFVVRRICKITAKTNSAIANNNYNDPNPSSRTYDALWLSTEAHGPVSAKGDVA